MHKYLSYILITLIAFSCARDPLRFKKKDSIPKKDLVPILVELHLMDAFTNHHEFYYKFSANDTLDIYNSIFEKYGYSRSEFDSTIANYTKRPDLYELVYNDVMMKLNYILDTLQNNDPMFEKEDMKVQRKNEGIFVY